MGRGWGVRVRMLRCLGTTCRFFVNRAGVRGSAGQLSGAAPERASSLITPRHTRLAWKWISVRDSRPTGNLMGISQPNLVLCYDCRLKKKESVDLLD